MEEMKLGAVESHFADIVWENQPLSTKDLVKLCEKELECERGLFKTENSTVTALISKNEFQAIQSEHFVGETFDGSLPAFIAAFTSRKKLSEKEIEEIRRMIDAFEG